MKKYIIYPQITHSFLKPLIKILSINFLTRKYFNKKFALKNLLNFEEVNRYMYKRAGKNGI